jgi:uncharacterized protein YjiS (DUF1127 family)
MSTFVSTILSTFAVWRERAVTRRALRLLDERGIRDIGADTATVWRETAKPFWSP